MTRSNWAGRWPIKPRVEGQKHKGDSRRGGADASEIPQPPMLPFVAVPLSTNPATVTPYFAKYNSCT
jgi:hypothetical protein